MNEERNDDVGESMDFESMDLGAATEVTLGGVAIPYEEGLTNQP